MDQTDHFRSILQKKFGEFALIQNPKTGVAWTSEYFINYVSPVLWDNEDQLELFFYRVELYNLLFREDAKELFIEMAKNKGICLNVEFPRITS